MGQGGARDERGKLNVYGYVQRKYFGPKNRGNGNGKRRKGVTGLVGILVFFLWGVLSNDGPLV